MVQVCGPVSIGSGDHAVRVRGGQPQTVLAVLAVEGRPVSAETLADVLWGDRPGHHWTGALRGVLTKIRRALAAAGVHPDLLCTDHGSVWLDATVRTELDRAVELLDPRAGEHPDPDRLRDLATDLRRPFLVHDTSEWSESQRYRILALQDRVDHAVLDALRAAGRRDDAIRWARDQLARERTDERAHHALIELLLDRGDLPGAHEAYAELERMLAAEYRVEPDPALRQRLAAHRAPIAPLDLGPPRPHHPHAAEPFVGRREELAAIAAAWERVSAGGRTELVVLQGPAGMGKTRLADRAATTLPGAQVLWGRSRPAGDRSFGPVADALAGAFDRSAAVARAASSTAPDIGLLVPDPNVPPRPDAADGLPVRDRALHAARDLLRRIVERPTVLVVDDLQWTSEDGMAVIETVLLHTGGPLLVIATCRELPERLSHQLSIVQRNVPVTTLVLPVLTLDELTLLCDAVDDAAPEQIAAVHRQTGGVPFFAAELVRDARRRGDGLDPDRVPDSLADWLDRYLHSLSPAERDTLELVTVLGRGADLAVVEQLSDLDAGAVAGVLDHLAERGLVVIADDGAIRVPHDLTGRSIYGGIGAARRSLLHRLVGDELDRAGGRPELVALHWSKAGPTRRAQAVGALLAAGRSALGTGAWSTALEHVGRALELTNDPDRRIAALTVAGTARLQLNRHREARADLEAAVALAEVHRRALAAAEATLLLVGRAGRGAILDDDATQIRLLRSARRLLTEAGEGEARAELVLAHVERELALSLLFTGTHEERAELLQGAVERIRRSPNASPDDLATTLLGRRITKLGGADLADRLADLDEVLALPVDRLAPETRIAAHAYRHEDLLRAGRREEADDHLRRGRLLADRHGHAYWRWAIGTWEALGRAIDGDLDAAEAAADAAAAGRDGVLEAAACRQVNQVAFRLLAGRAAETIATLDAAVALFPHIPAYRAVLALALAEAGEGERARTVVGELATSGFDAIPPDTNRFLALAVLAHAAATVGHEAAAPLLHDLLVPFAGQQVLVNCYGGGGACWGPVSWALARLGPLAGRPPAETAARWRAAVGESAAVPALAPRIAAEAP